MTGACAALAFTVTPLHPLTLLMVHPLFLLSGAVGVTLIVANGKVFKPLRVWLKRGKGLRAWLGALLSCTMCFGFWVGLAGGLILDAHRSFLPDPELIYAILAGGAVSLWSYVADLLLLRLEVGLGDELAVDPDLADAVCVPPAAPKVPGSASAGGGGDLAA